MLTNLYALNGAKMEEPVMFNNSTFFMGIALGDKHSGIAIIDKKEDLVEGIAPPS